MPTPLAPKKVLIVDDTATMRKLIRTFAESFSKSFTFFEANNGAQANQIAATEKVDVIFMDLNMPEIGGVAGLRLLKANPATREIPVIIVTTFDQTDDIEKCKSLGAAALIRKPVKLADVHEALRFVFT